MTLDQVKKGSEIEIVSVPDKESRSHLLRLGIAVGTRVFCYEKMPKGPIIIMRRRQEVAVGRELARSIIVK